MDEASALQGLMEFGVGLAGFTAVVFVLRPQQSKIDLGTIFSVRAALAESIGTILACLVALGVSAVGVDGSARWRASSAIYLFLMMYFLVVFWRDTLRAHGAGVPVWQSAGVWLVSGIHVLLHLSNVVGLPAGPSFARYYVACIVLVALGVLLFLTVALRLLRPSV